MFYQIRSTMNRRDILKTGLASSMLSVFPIGGIISRNNYNNRLEKPLGNYTLLLKHGQAGWDSNFYFCVCNVINHLELNQRIGDILARNRYRSRLKYSSNDRHKINPGIEIIELISSSQDVNIKIFEMLSSEAALNNIKPTDYINKVGRITESCLEGNSGSELLMKQEGSSAYANFAKNSISSLTGKEIQWVNTYNDKILQALELVTGCIYADLAGKNLEASAKIELRNASRRAYSVETFSVNIDRENLKISRLKI